MGGREAKNVGGESGGEDAAAADLETLAAGFLWKL